jgi:hypothetical protein
VTSTARFMSVISEFVVKIAEREIADGGERRAK